MCPNNHNEGFTSTGRSRLVNKNGVAMFEYEYKCDKCGVKFWL